MCDPDDVLRSLPEAWWRPGWTTVLGWLWGQHEALLISLGWALFILLVPAGIGELTMLALMLVGVLSMYRGAHTGRIVWRGAMPIFVFTFAISLALSSGMRALAFLL